MKQVLFTCFKCGTKETTPVGETAIPQDWVRIRFDRLYTDKLDFLDPPPQTQLKSV